MKPEIEKTIKLEGGWVNDPTDTGGETKYGISKTFNPDVDIKNLTPEGAEKIYLERYWTPLNLDRYHDIRFRWKLFDIAVNQGVGTAKNFRDSLGMIDCTQAIVDLCRMQMKRYVEKVIAQPVKLKYLRGWTNRAFETGEDLVA